MSLVRAECQRFFARRFIRIMFVVVVALLAIVAIGTAHSSHRVGPADHARARQQVAEEIAQQQQLFTQCTQAQAAGLPDPNSGGPLPPGATCTDFYPTDQVPQESWFLPTTWTLADQGQNMIIIFGGLLALFGFATGASFIGAEWSSGGMMNLLLWRPRRLALLTQKLGALLLSVLASGLGLAVIWALMIWGLVSTRARLGTVTSGMWQSFGLTGARSLALGLAAAIAGFAFASIGRHTATALGIVVGYIVVVEGGGLVFLPMLHIARPERFALSHYAEAWLFKVAHFFGAQVCQPMAGNSFSCEPGHEWVIRLGSAAEIGGILLAALLVWAYVSFWRRDVT